MMKKNDFMELLILDIAKKAQVHNFSSYEIFEETLCGGFDSCRRTNNFFIIFYDENKNKINQISVSNEIVNILMP